MKKKLYVYILECADDSYYVGVTNNPGMRLIQHNKGVNPTAYTYSRRPCKMAYCEMFSDFMAAVAREKQIKRWSRAKKEALIYSRWEKLKQLAECRNETHCKNNPRLRPA